MLSLRVRRIAAVVTGMSVIGAAVFAVGASANSSKSVTVKASADAHVQAGSSKNAGSANVLRVSSSDRAWVRFSTKSLPSGATVTKVALKVYVRGGQSGKLEVHPASDSWKENTITAKNAPKWNGTVLATTKVKGSGWKTVSLPTKTIGNKGSFSLGLRSSKSTVQVASQESKNAPRLVVTYATPSTGGGKGTTTTTEVSVDDTPTTDVPADDSPVTEPPTTDVPADDTPTEEPPTTDVPAETPTTTSAAPGTTTTTAAPAGGAGSSGKPVATRETAALPNATGDVSDDSAIWYNSANPGASVVIGDNKASKGGGLAVYDMSGNILQYRPDGMIGNVDIRDGFSLNGRSIVLVGANNRTSNTIVFYELDRTTRQLTPISARSITTVSPNYGFCLYKSPATSKYYAFVTQDSGSTTEQYELSAVGGKVDATKVRTISVGSQSEGCVADDETGAFYIGEEAVAIWRYNAEPSGGSTRVAVGRVGDGHLKADIEGLALTYGPNGAGSLIVSSQGNSTFAVYSRSGANAFVRNFAVGGSGSVDAVTGTDGVDARVGNFGPGFEQGLLVVHDQSNTGGSSSNLKFVPLQTVTG